MAKGEFCSWLHLCLWVVNLLLFQTNSRLLLLLHGLSFAKKHFGMDTAKVSSVKLFNLIYLHHKENQQS